jgi:hypothetical protein
MRKFSFFLLTVVLFSFNITAFASGHKYIINGQAPTIAWSVGGNTTSCAPATNYPSGAVYNTWSGAGTSAVGSRVLPAVTTTNGAGYWFSCSANSISDTAWLHIYDPPVLSGTCTQNGSTYSITVTWPSADSNYTSTNQNVTYQQRIQASTGGQTGPTGASSAYTTVATSPTTYAANNITGNSITWTGLSAGTWGIWGHVNDPDNGASSASSIAEGVNCGPTFPDLTADSPTFNPTTGTVGSSVTITSLIHNAPGGASTGAGFTNLFQYTTAVDASNNATGPITDISPTGSSATMAAGGSANTSTSLAPTGSGTVYVRACADKSSAANTGTINEGSNENNNCSAWVPFTINPRPNDSQCVSISAPSPVTTNQQFSATITMKNIGSNTWNTANTTNPWKLGSQDVQDNNTWGMNRVTLPSNTATNGQVSFTTTFTAPSTAGTYNFDWQMVQEFVGWFGEKCIKSITVNPPAAVTGDIKANNLDSGATCTIPVGGSTCTGTISWTTTPPTNSSVWIGTANPATAPSGSFSAPWLARGINTFELRQGTTQSGALLDTVDITGQCATGTTWNSIQGVCAPNEPAFVSASCTLQGNGTYSIALSWGSVSTAAYYPQRLNGPSHATGNSGGYTMTTAQRFSPNDTDVIDPVTGTSITWTGITAAGNYDYWWHAWNSNPSPGGSWSSNTVRTVNCGVPAQPDLTAGAITPTTATVNSPTTLSSTITNGGAASTGAGFTTLFQRATSYNAQTDTASGVTDIGTFVRNTALSQTSPNNTFVATLTNYDFGSTATTYYVRACADKSSAANNGSITESNDNNNCGPWTAVVVSNAQVNSCSAQGVNWGTGNSCAAVLSAGSGSQVVNNNTTSAPDYLGSATYTCSSGTWTGPTSATCTCNDPNAGNYGGAAPCTAPATVVTINVTGAGNITTTPSTQYVQDFNVSVSDGGGWACRLVDGASGAYLTNWQSGITSYTRTSPASNGDYQYTVHCRAASDTSVTDDDPYHLYVCPSGMIWDSTTSACVLPPDLTASALSPTSAQTNASTTYIGTITNQGGKTVTTNFRYFFQVSQLPGGGDSNPTDLSSGTMNTDLAHDESAVVSKSYTFVTAGPHSMRVCADKRNSGDNGQVDETPPASNEQNNCGPWTDIYVGATTGTLTMPSTCTIPSQNAACPATVSWTTQNATTSVTVQRAYSPFGTIPGGTGNSGSTNVNFSPPGSYTLNLMHGTIVLDTKTITVTCQSNSNWNGASSVCEDTPPSITVTDPGPSCNHTSPCALQFMCSGATKYAIYRDGTLVTATTTYSGPVSQNVSIQGNYTMVCINGTTLDSDVIFYDPAPLQPTAISLTGAPRTIESGGKVTLSFSITNPIASCKITVTPVCTGVCGAAQTNAASALQTSLNSSSVTTDSNDPNGARTMSNALHTTVSGSQALGKKTIQVTYTSDFLLGCGTATAASSSVRVITSKNNEG